MENQLMEMKFEGTAVRIVKDENGEPWFVAKDVCDVLNLGNSRDVSSRLDDDEKADVGISDGRQDRIMTAINESGLYSLILRSNKPEAKVFKKWVTRDVLPAIRKTGNYSLGIPKTLPEALRAYATEIEKTTKLEGQLAIAAPKAEFYDAVGQSKNALSMREVAKLIGYSGIGQNNLFNFLKNQKILISTTEPYQEYINRGYFKVIMTPYTNRFGETFTRNKILTTGRGIDFIRRKLMRRLRENNHQEAFNL